MRPPDHRPAAGYRSATDAPPVVVVVEDDPAMRHSLKFLLEVEGYVVSTHNSRPSSALDEALAGAACVIVDDTPPGTSGLDVLDGLRRRGCRLPAILIASHPDERKLSRAMASGAFVVEKPLLDDVLHRALEGAIAGGPVD